MKRFIVTIPPTTKAVAITVTAIGNHVVISLGIIVH